MLPGRAVVRALRRAGLVIMVAVIGERRAIASGYQGARGASRGGDGQQQGLEAVGIAHRRSRVSGLRIQKPIANPSEVDDALSVMISSVDGGGSNKGIPTALAKARNSSSNARRISIPRLAVLSQRKVMAEYI
jgi:hypothetical protein